MTRRLCPLTAIGIVVGIAGAGCGRSANLMPLDQGKSWTYTVRAGFQTFVEPVTVDGKVAVGSGEGVVLKGAMGTSWMGWNGTTLLASRLANATFVPPVPLALGDVPVAGEGGTAWSGRIEAFGVKRQARGTLKQAPERLVLGGVKVRCVRTTLSLLAQPESGREKSPRGDERLTKIQVTTWLRPGYGIVRQEQHTDRKLVVALNLLDGE